MGDLISRQAVLNTTSATLRITGKKNAETVYKYIKKMCDDIKALPSAQHWIPCSKRLPRQGQEVICQCRANIIKVLKLDANGDWYQDAEHCYMSGFVIAWMPLPEPYQRGEKE